MFMFLTEKKALKLRKKYPNMGFFTTDRSNKHGVLDDEALSTVEYHYPEALYPPVDEIQAYVRGEMSIKKIIKNMKKRVEQLKHETVSTEFQMALYTILAMNDDPKTIVCFLKVGGDNEESNKLNKLYEKYIEKLLGIFGLECYDDYSKKLLKGKKKTVRNNIAKYCVSRSTMNKHGRYRRLIISHVHYAEIQKATLESALRKTTQNRDTIISVNNLSSKQLKGVTDRFMSTLSGAFIPYLDSHVQTWPSKKIYKDTMKYLRKMSKRYVESYNEYCDIVNGLELPDMKKLPKVKSPKKMKKNKKYVNKMVKFYSKRKNVPFILGAYTHIWADINGVECGSKEYNNEMTQAHRLLQNRDFAKAYAKMTTEIKKMLDEDAKRKAEAKAAAK